MTTPKQASDEVERLAKEHALKHYPIASGSIEGNQREMMRGILRANFKAGYLARDADVREFVGAVEEYCKWNRNERALIVALAKFKERGG